MRDKIRVAICIGVPCRTGRRVTWVVCRPCRHSRRSSLPPLEDIWHRGASVFGVRRAVDARSVAGGRSRPVSLPGHRRTNDAAAADCIVAATARDIRALKTNLIHIQTQAAARRRRSGCGEGARVRRGARKGRRADSTRLIYRTRSQSACHCLTTRTATAAPIT